VSALVDHFPLIIPEITILPLEPDSALKPITTQKYIPKPPLTISLTLQQLQPNKPQKTTQTNHTTKKTTTTKQQHTKHPQQQPNS
jgi:hypothetical protein